MTVVFITKHVCMTFSVVQLMWYVMGWARENRQCLLNDSVCPSFISTIVTWQTFYSNLVNLECQLNIFNSKLAFYWVEWSVWTERHGFPNKRRSDFWGSYSSYKKLFSADRNAEHNGHTLSTSERWKKDLPFLKHVSVKDANFCIWPSTNTNALCGADFRLIRIAPVS